MTILKGKKSIYTKIVSDDFGWQTTNGRGFELRKMGDQMTRDEILSMAKEAGGFLGELPKGDAWMFFEEAYLERFAALVAEKEREACAKVCEDVSEQFHAHAMDCAVAIRARGQK